MIGLVLGGLLGLGIAVTATAFGPATPLSELLDDLGTGATKDNATRTNHWPGRRLFARLVEARAVDDLFVGSRFSSDLEVCERSRVDFAGATVGKSTVPLVFVVVFVYLADLGRGLTAVLLGLAGAVIFMLTEVRAVQNEAEQRRSDMLRALTAYIEFARIAAHTQSVEGAMRSSAGMGATWPFRLVERVFDQSRRRGEAPWTGMAQLGETYDLREITELAGALEIAAEEGTQVQEMLAAKASSLRRRMTEAEVAEADAATEKLSVPMALIGLTIFVLLLAPAALAF